MWARVDGNSLPPSETLFPGPAFGPPPGEKPTKVHFAGTLSVPVLAWHSCTFIHSFGTWELSGPHVDLIHFILKSNRCSQSDCIAPDPKSAVALYFLFVVCYWLFDICGWLRLQAACWCGSNLEGGRPDFLCGVGFVPFKMGRDRKGDLVYLSSVQHRKPLVSYRFGWRLQTILNTLIQGILKVEVGVKLTSK